jgi:uncharacterized membrane protein
MILNIIRWFICVIYGGLTIFACITSLYSNISEYWVNILMGLSALFLIIINLKIFKKKLPLLVLSLLILQICAIMNGYYLGTNNMLHHITRLIVHIGIFVLFHFSMKGTREKQ